VSEREVQNRRVHCPVTKTLWPGQAGTVKLGRQWGHTLVCVRYRRDATGTTRYTTVELLIDTAPIQKRRSDRTIVGVKIAPHDMALRTHAMAMGAKWNRRARLWTMSFKVARTLGLTAQIHPF
jgi:hypothetical protein